MLKLLCNKYCFIYSKFLLFMLKYFEDLYAIFNVDFIYDFSIINEDLSNIGGFEFVSVFVMLRY